MLSAPGVLNIYSRLSYDYYIADIALEYLDDDTLIVLTTQSKHFKDKTYNLLFKRQQYTTKIIKNCSNLTIIPKEIKYIRNLEFLNIFNNQIREIPEIIGQLTNLRWLYLSNNKIREIPNTIGELTNLKYLNLHNNQIRDVPESIWQLTNLKNLYLSYNQIREIPNSIGKLTNLKVLYLHNNQIEIMPDLNHLINCYIKK